MKWRQYAQLPPLSVSDSKMLRLTASFILLAASLVHGAQPLYGQCGGVGYSGDTTCVSGAVCTRLNDFYSQCLPGAPATSTPPPVSTPPPPATTSTIPALPTSTVAPPAGTPIPGTDASTADVVSAFNQYNVTSRFGIKFNPTAILGVTFTANSQPTIFKAGQSVARNVTASTPQLSLYGPAGSGPFVIIMADPDVPTPQNPTYGPVRHWLAGNYYPSPTSNVLTPSGTAITPYFQPTPGVGSPAHRYTFLLYKQPANFNEQRVVTPQTSILNWNVSQFATQVGLGDPVAGTFMMVTM
ncbi:phosphatidylethanolamine-binding protein [Coprinopsis sp. MPI-PUGE-AT-0042]|nr:phosphatidylethanolamine-binding protein [Coprinopsis sp. MPI-PUGE-AT-0042]